MIFRCLLRAPSWNRNRPSSLCGGWILHKKQSSCIACAAYSSLQRPTRPLVDHSTTTLRGSWMFAPTSSSLPSTTVATTTGQIMSFHFASRDYARCFVDLPIPDTATLRRKTFTYLQDQWDADLWYRDPIVSLLKGQKLMPSTTAATTTTPPPHGVVDTVNALGIVNGQQIVAGPAEVQLLKDHIMTYQSCTHDLRIPIRKVEGMLFGKYAGFLIGNQCIDFQKQDGITEIEESIMANTIERRLSDLLLQAEQDGQLSIHRKPIYVSCVSNFTNFLDLSRKTIRSLEVGIPCIILGRSNTSQHSYPWTQLLLQLCQEQGIDPGMITYLSCTLDDIRDITSSCQAYTGNLYVTTSRPLAAAIKANYYKTIASTGGPNTLVTTEWTPAVQAAIQMSASIECAGQCTALRHCVVPTNVDNEILSTKLLSSLSGLQSATQALQEGKFDGVFGYHAGSSAPSSLAGYQTIGKKGNDDNDKASVDAYLKIGNPNELPELDMNEYWRKVVVDVSKLDLIKTTTAGTTKGNMASMQNVELLAHWLNQNQPISLAINGPRSQAIKLGLDLFEKTGLVVYTIGSIDNNNNNNNNNNSNTMPPAMTCQARPQEGEIFGEFPPRNDLHKYTCFPVIVPSSNPSYDAVYTKSFLLENSMHIPTSFPSTVQKMLTDIQSDIIRGYCILLIRYLQEVCSHNPKRGLDCTNRTALWGLQRPPVNRKTILQCQPISLSSSSWGDDDDDDNNNNDNNTVSKQQQQDQERMTWDAVAPLILLFYVTNARAQLELSINPDATELIASCMKYNLHFHNSNTNNNKDDGSSRHDLSVVVESMDTMTQRLQACQHEIYHQIPLLGSKQHLVDLRQQQQVDGGGDGDGTGLPMVGNWVSLFLPLGHIKSTMANDEEFLFKASLSPKWLNSLF